LPEGGFAAPTSRPSSGAARHLLPTGEGGGCAGIPLTVGTSRATNPLIFLTLQKSQRHQPARVETALRLSSSRRWGGRRIQRLDVGGLWSSDEARRMETSGVLVVGDGCRLPARRALKAGPPTSSCPSLVRSSNGPGGDPVRPEARAASRRARGKRLRGAGQLRRNGKFYPITGRGPAAPRPPQPPVLRRRRLSASAFSPCGRRCPRRGRMRGETPIRPWTASGPARLPAEQPLHPSGSAVHLLPQGKKQTESHP